MMERGVRPAPFLLSIAQEWVGTALRAYGRVGAVTRINTGLIG
jgi:hypothetical protein